MSYSGVPISLSAYDPAKGGLCLRHSGLQVELHGKSLHEHFFSIEPIDFDDLVWPGTKSVQVFLLGILARVLSGGGVLHAHDRRCLL